MTTVHGFKVFDVDQDAINRMIGGRIGGYLPAGTTVEVARLPDLRLVLELRAVAVAP